MTMTMTITHAFPLTLSQQDIYFDQLHHGHSPIYNVGGYIAMTGIDPQRMEAAHRKVVEENDVFGIRITVDAQGVTQSISQVRTGSLPLLDFSRHDNPEGVAREWLTGLFESPLHIDNAELFKAYLARLDGERYWYVALAHHLMVDGLGFANWAHALGRHYAGLEQEEEKKREEEERWEEVVTANQEYVAIERFAQSREYWIAHCASLPEPMLPMHYGPSRENAQGTRSSKVCIEISPEQYGRFSAFAHSHDVGLAQLFLGVLAVYFGKVYGRERVAFGVPAHNRSGALQKNMVGVFTNITPLCVTVDRNAALFALCEEIGKQQQRNFRHQRFPGGHIKRDLLDLRLISPGQGLYEIGFNYLKMDSALNVGAQSSRSAQSAQLVYVGNNHQKTPLMVTVWEYREGEPVELQIEANLVYFTPQEARLLGERFLHMLEWALSHPDLPVSECEVMPKREVESLLFEMNATAAPYPKDLCIHELFERQAAKTPDAIAVVCGDKQLRYAELNARANRVAHRLRKEGIGSTGKESVVGLSVERSVEMVVGMLGILKAGGAYVPLDPSYPQARLEYMLQDSGARCVLVTSMTIAANTIGSCMSIVLDDEMEFAGYPTSNPQRPDGMTSENLAYVIYTSGSTGQPKGVEIRHRNTMALLAWAARSYTGIELQKVLASTSLNFDLSVFEIFVPLSYGYQCVIVQDALALLTLPGNQVDVTLINTVPSAIKALLVQQAIPDSVKVINLAGEPLSGKVVNDILSSTQVRKVCNLYGPSEDTTYSTYATFTQPVEGVPSIGKPLPNTRVYILSEAEQLAPTGAIGELYIGGAGVARGYRNKPVLTQERFVKIKEVEAEEVLYRTGDLVRYLPDGQLAFLGRKDDQIKLRGFRIELGEIEAQLNRLPGIKEAVVTVQERVVGGVAEEDKQLVAYVVGDVVGDVVGTCKAEEVKAGLRAVLPEYMVPSAVMVLECFPLTPNGKIDKRALPTMEDQQRESYVAPESETEKQLAAIWEEVLELERVGVHDNFFEIGGHSLSATRLATSVTVHWQMELSIRAVFENNTIDKMARLIDAMEEEKQEGEKNESFCRAPIPRADRLKALPLSYAQERLWLIDRIDGDSRQYNMPGAYLLCGTLDKEALRQSVNAIVARHEVLRTVFRQEGKNAVQEIIALPCPIPIEEHDLIDCPSLQQIQELERLRSNEAGKPFDLEKDAMLRVVLVHLGQDEAVLLLTFHHIAMDGWSIGVFAKELMALYAAHAQENLGGYEAQGIAVLQELDTQYADFACWQRQRFESDASRSAESMQYWLRQLEDLPPVHSLPLDFVRPLQQSYRGKVVRSALDVATVGRLQSIAHSADATLFMVLQSAFAVLLSRWCNEQDIVIGTPVAGRMRKEVEGLIGFFANTLVLRTQVGAVKEGQGFLALLEQVKKTTLDGYMHQEVPFEMLVERLKPERSLGHTPLFQIMFSLQSNEMPVLELPDLKIAPLRRTYGHAKFDLELMAQETAKGLMLKWVFAEDLFETATIERMANGFALLIEQLLEDPKNLNRAVEQLDCVSQPEKEMMARWNDTAVPYPRDLCIHELFERQVAKTPDAIAVVCGEKQLRYAELNARANRVAHRLRKEGVGSESVVGLLVERSVEMVVGMLGILKAGGAYVPLDPSYPQARLGYMLQDSDARCILAHRSLCNRLPWNAVKALVLDDEAAFAGYPTSNPQRPDGMSPENLAYVIYTSGSTGQPKGVEIRHRNTMALLAWAAQAYTPIELRRVLASTSLNFDLSVFEIFVPLSYGYRCVIVQDALALLMLPGNQVDVTLINTVPSAIKALLAQQAIPDSVKVINLAGEPLSGKVVNDILVSTYAQKVCNLYGPSEDTTYSTYATFTQPVEGVPSIGKPLPNTKVYILTEAEQPAPIGAVGELYISGAGVARGYRNKPVLTQERFVRHVIDGQVLYRTGDLVRYLPDGQLAFLGRKDDQIKLRGFRIELGEIEAQLNRLPGIKEALVTVQEREGGDKQLVAYVVSDVVGECSGEVLRAGLRGSLPEYMIPSVVMVLERFPLTPNGKIDKRALPAMEAQQRESYVAPESETEKKLAAIWGEVLGLERVGVHDNFFEIGGYSLPLVQIIHVAATRFGLCFSPKELFQALTVRNLARIIDEKMHSSMHSSTSSIVHIDVDSNQPVPLSYAQYRIWFLQNLRKDSNEFNIAGGVSIDSDLDPERVQETIGYLVKRHAALRTRIRSIDGEPFQVVDDAMESRVIYHDLTSHPEEDKWHVAESISAQHDASVFDLDGMGPLFSFLLIRIDHKKFRLHAKFHHIVTDGWSISLFFNEFVERYHAPQFLRSPALNSPAVQYSDYVRWQTGFLKSNEAREQEAFWKSYLKDSKEILTLPFQHARGSIGDMDDAEERRPPRMLRARIESSICRQLQDSAKRSGGSMFHVLHSALVVLLARLTRQTDVNIGVPVSGRHVPGLHEVFGVMINNLPVRSRIDLSQGFDDVLRDGVRNVFDVLSNQDLPFERILELVGAERDRHSTPLFQILFNMLSLPDMEASCARLSAAMLPSIDMDSKFNLTFYIAEMADGIADGIAHSIDIRLAFNQSVFQLEDVEILLAQYVSVLTQIARNGAIACGDIDLHAGLNIDLNIDLKKEIHIACPGTVPDCLRHIAQTSPERIAIQFGDVQWTYRTLDEVTDYYATMLRKKGVRARVGDIVGIMAERTDTLVIATLAILKAGAAFMMLSNAAPPARTANQLAQCQPKCLIVLDAEWQPASEVREFLHRKTCPILVVSRHVVYEDTFQLDEKLGEDDLAYVSFTSGTEGTPKVIAGLHGSLTMFHPWAQSALGVNENDRFSMFSGLVHDPLQRDMFTPLCMGAMLCIPDESMLHRGDIGAWMMREEISILNMTPSLGKQLVGMCKKPVPSVRWSFFVGEPLTAALIEQFETMAPNSRFINFYGSTESSRAIAFYEVPRSTAAGLAGMGKTFSFPIGRGISGTQIVVLNACNDRYRLCGPGELGQIGIRSRYLTRGYWNDPALTAKKFIPNPYGADVKDRIYLTGDMGSYRADGMVECLGRMDSQIKIRGFRVETAEIETALHMHPCVREAAIMTRRDAAYETMIVAYVVWKEGNTDADVDMRTVAAELREHLKRMLPVYMIPAQFVFLKKIPLTENGKLDVHALPAFSFDRFASSGADMAKPESPIERELLTIWEKSFGRTGISVTDDFFELGGHSLLMTRLLAEMKFRFAVDIGFEHFFERNSIRDIASLIALQIEMQQVIDNVLASPSAKQKITL